MHFDKTILVVDDFFPDPMAVRDRALSAEYENTPDTQNYPGKNTTASHWNSELDYLIKQTVKENVRPQPTSSCGHFRYTGKHDVSKQLIHFDPKPTQCWAGVIYLSLPEHYTVDGTALDAGTKIYSHKRTGMATAPKDHVESSVIGVHTVEDMKNFFETEGLDQSLWQVELNVPFKFNRLVLFRPWLWHGIAGHFGTDITNSRLTQLIFLTK